MGLYNYSGNLTYIPHSGEVCVYIYMCVCLVKYLTIILRKWFIVTALSIAPYMREGGVAWEYVTGPAKIGYICT